MTAFSGGILLADGPLPTTKPRVPKAAILIVRGWRDCVRPSPTRSA
ncbi:hypothetical protein H6F95_07520 [Cyanobacteria bacterium FACHB-471]|nr:hypothetical protein [Cyanobacteria bacterium FACHB-471]